MFEKKPKAPLPGRDKLAEAVQTFNIPGSSVVIGAPSRPFLDAIRKDRIEKQVEMNKLEREINRLWELERFADSHETADALVKYFLERTSKSTQAGLVPPIPNTNPSNEQLQRAYDAQRNYDPKST